MSEKIGRYELLSEIGRGAMAIVFLAYDPAIGRRVAVKILHSQFSSDSELRDRFKREAEVIARLEQHPCIVPVYDYGEEDDRLFIVTRFMPGGSLEDRLRNGLLPLTQVIPIFDRLALALDYIHKKDILHRDLKPGNVLFDKEGEAFLADFGFAKILADSNSTEPSSGLGTPAYMSPEQVKGISLDSRSDIYSLGVVLHESVTGRRPYLGDVSEVGLKHISDPIPHLASDQLLELGLPAYFNSILARALAKEPKDRYATAGAMVQALKVLLEAPTASIRRIGRYEIVKPDPLGRGWMSIVYLARDPSMQRDVAVKVLRFEHVGDSELRARFQREVGVVASLEGQGCIVPVYDHGEDREGLFTVMRCMSGGTLASRIAGKPMPLTEVVPIIQRLAAALDYAHEKSIIHRDVKPSNVLFDNDDYAFLTDFGFAKVLDVGNPSEPSAGYGTPAYMSPEQVERKKLDKRSDIYSLGVVLYEMLIGSRPYSGDRSVVGFRHVRDPVPQLTPDRLEDLKLPAPINMIFDRALAKAPDDRYATAGELARALSELLSPPITDPSPTWDDAPEPLQKVLKAKPVRKIWAIFSALAVIGGVVGLFAYMYPPTAPSAAVTPTLSERAPFTATSKPSITAKPTNAISVTTVVSATAGLSETDKVASSMPPLGTSPHTPSPSKTVFVFVVAPSFSVTPKPPRPFTLTPMPTGIPTPTNTPSHTNGNGPTPTFTYTPTRTLPPLDTDTPSPTP